MNGRLHITQFKSTIFLSTIAAALGTNQIEQNNNVNIFFYNRTDKAEIISILSPHRSKILKAIPVLYYIGLLTNALCISILLQKQLLYRKSIFYLVFLAFSDLMYNFFSQLPQFLIDVDLINYHILKQSNVSCFFYDLSLTSFHFYSVILTLFVTTDRFIYIYRPLKLNRAFDSIKSKLVLGIVLYFVSVIIALPHGFLMVYSEVERDCDARAFFKKKVGNTGFTYYQMYFTFTEPIIIWVIPGMLILIMNSYVIYKIFKSSKISSKTVVGGYRPSHSNSKFTIHTVGGASSVGCGEHKNSLSVSHHSRSNAAGPSTIELKSFSAHESEPMLNDRLSSSTMNINKAISGSRSGSENNKNKTNSNKSQTNLLSNNLRRASIASNILSATGKLAGISVNQISHYITIIALGFYFIVTTIPYGLLLSYQNNLTLKLNYHLPSKEDYLSDSLWTRYGTYREYVALSRLFFVSNHCLNFFFYFLFNRMFRDTLVNLLSTFFRHLRIKLRLDNCFNQIKSFICNKESQKKNRNLNLEFE
jgi:hypothetical protein